MPMIVPGMPNPLFLTGVCFAEVNPAATWNPETTTEGAATTNSFYRMAFSPELSVGVAVGISGTGLRAAYSTGNGTWTRVNSGNDSKRWWDVCWSPSLGLFAACANTAATNCIMTSPDGIVWTERTVTSSNGFTCICWSESLGLFVALSGNHVITSSNGIAWSATASSWGAANWGGVTWVTPLNKFVAVGNSGGSANDIMTSAAGSAWTMGGHINDTQDTWERILWVPEISKVVAINNSGLDTVGRIAVSGDSSLSWNLPSTPNSITKYGSVTYIHDYGLIAIQDETSAAFISLSTDSGATWGSNGQMPVGIGLNQSLMSATTWGEFGTAIASGSGSLSTTGIYAFYPFLPC